MEKIIVRVEVDGVELAPIEMGEGHEDLIYKEEMTLFKMGHVFNIEHTRVPYGYTLSLSRHKTKEELALRATKNDDNNRNL